MEIDKMVKTIVAVGGGGLSSFLKSKKFQKTLNNNFKFNKKAFSIAEAMITLLIVGVTLAMAAPVVTKHNTTTDIQTSLLNKKLTELQERVETIENSVVPSGLVAFFNIPCENISPQNSWTAVPTDWQGRYPRIVGSYQVLDKDGLNPIDKTLAYGEIYEDASRKFTGYVDLYGNTGVWKHSGIFSSTTGKDGGTVNGSNLGLSSDIKIDSSLVLPTADEIRVKTVGLYMCVKQ